jgi:phage terminase large subunit
MSNGTQNDQFFISHRHYEEDSLPNIEESEETDDDNASIVHIRQYSAAKKKPSSVLLATV